MVVHACDTKAGSSELKASLNYKRLGGSVGLEIDLFPFIIDSQPGT